VKADIFLKDKNYNKNDFEEMTFCFKVRIAAHQIPK
jgi:hypothetical protein